MLAMRKQRRQARFLLMSLLAQRSQLEIIAHSFILTRIRAVTSLSILLSEHVIM